MWKCMRCEKENQNTAETCIGCGPGGLYAAFTAAQRGHAVTLYEKGDILGGNMRLAAYPPGKGDITNMVRSYIAKCEEYGVKMVMNTEVTPAMGI